MANGLGRGFDSLIPTGFVVDDVVSPGEKIRNLDVDKLTINPEQPRKYFDETSLNELAESISEHGIIQPLVVTSVKDSKGTYRIVAGERRFRAANKAGLKTVPVIVRNHETLEELEIALVENVQRVDLSAIEQAVSIMRLRDQFSLSMSDISKKLGKAETTVSNIIRLLKLPKKAITALQKNEISEGHARAILALKTDEKLQLELLNKIIFQQLSVRDAESFVKDHKTKNDSISKLPEAMNKRLKQLKKSKGIVPHITSKKSGGSLKISYKNQEELDSILTQLEK